MGGYGAHLPLAINSVKPTLNPVYNARQPSTSEGLPNTAGSNYKFTTISFKNVLTLMKYRKSIYAYAILSSIGELFIHVEKTLR